VEFVGELLGVQNFTWVAGIPHHQKNENPAICTTNITVSDQLLVRNRKISNPFG